MRLSAAQKDQVDQFGELDHKVSQFRPTLKRRDELRKAIENWLADSPADLAAVLDGRLYQVHAAAKGVETVIDIPGVYKRLGAQRFLTVAQVSMQDLRRLLDGETIEKLVKQERTGCRKLTAVRLE